MASVAGTETNREQFATVQLSGLAVGAHLRSPIYDDRDDRNVLLLAAGTTVSAAILEKLKSRGISRVRVHRSELANVTGGGSAGAGGGTARETADAQRAKEATRRAAAQTTTRTGGTFALKHNSFTHAVKKHGASPVSKQVCTEYANCYQQSVGHVETFFDALGESGSIDAKCIVDVSRDSLMQLAADLDLFATLGIQPGEDKYPSRHSMQTGMLAMSVGTTLGLTQAELLELGIGCLIHDAGMLHIRQDLVHTDRKLGSIEFLEITKHPLLTFDMIRNISEIPTGARMVAYQMHERYNGTGYPRGRKGTQIHPLARIACVADVYIALISPRPHRPGMLPYLAMEKMIKDTRAGLYDPSVVRALLNTISLFPLGSHIETSDGRVGTVIRSNGLQFARPIVQLWPCDNSHIEAAVVDLSRENNLQIVRPLENLTAGADNANENADDGWE
jgi:HD-GYP domain-containing protein (c-di-GMP phosphodiesterase class II)